MTDAEATGPLWSPSPSRVAGTQLESFRRYLTRRGFAIGHSYAELHAWSVVQAPDFWAALWDWAGTIGERGPRLVVRRDPSADLRSTRFLPDAWLSLPENLLAGDAEALAVIEMNEEGVSTRLTRGALRRRVAQVAAALRRDGVQIGDRVAGIVSNSSDALVAALATLSIGATWSSCSPDFGVDGIVDRFAQIEPVVLIATESYVYGGKHFDCRAKTREVAARLPTVRRVVDTEHAWKAWVNATPDAPIEYVRVPFDHPAYILYSSGTTGVPKCIVHGTGGTLLQHLKELRLHYDVKPSDRVFYFTTCGWMMWNWLISALACEAAVVLYDGSPVHPTPARLFDLADEAGITFFGVSARYLESVRKSGVVPAESHRLSSVRTVTSTGSPLSADAFEFVYAHIKRDVHLASLSGGTDIVSCFMGGNPTAPVWPGELQAAGLAMDVRVFDAVGHDVKGEAGELVCATPFPSMPVGFWGDPGGTAYHRAYFDRFPGVWCHGDWVTETDHDGYVIHGRSDTTLNPGGVRIGTSEIYRQVETFDEILESLAVAQPWAGDERIVLFVRLRAGTALDDRLRQAITARVRTHASPRHVPAKIVAVPDLPRTRSGKLVEVAVRRLLQGLPVPNREALANPECLESFRDHPELRS